VTVGELKINLSADTNDFEKGMETAKLALMRMEKESTVTAKNVSAMAGKIAADMQADSPMMMQAGIDLIGGISAGIEQSADGLLGKVNRLGQSVISEIEKVFEIASPSQKTAYLGQMIGQGLAAGITESLGKVQLSAAGLYDSAQGISPAGSRTYNTYNTTYMGSGNNSEAVNLADLENRIRRAYA
jgi:hypothetical protein